MTPRLDTARLSTDLDCKFFDILNVGNLYPVPPNLVHIDDPALSGPRAPLPGSVVDESVSETADIQQSKLLFNGPVPSAWLGTGETQAARGDLAERVARKGVANGYAVLDDNIKLLPSEVTPGAGAGTVNTVRLLLPPEFTVPVNTITSSGTIAATWTDAPAKSYLGINGIGLGAIVFPSFLTDPLPSALIPPLDATIFVSGVLPVAQLPVAIGIGPDHAPGVVPDPGETGDHMDYLGRDMQWRQFDNDLPYQTFVPTPVITLLSWFEDTAIVSVNCSLEGVVLFARVTHPGEPVAEFTEAENHQAFSVLDFDLVESYAAKVGYNNSDIASYTVITPLTPGPIPPLEDEIPTEEPQ